MGNKNSTIFKTKQYRVALQYRTLNGGLEFAALALRVRVRVRVRVQLVKEQQQLLALLNKHGLDLSMGKSVSEWTVSEMRITQNTVSNETAPSMQSITNRDRSSTAATDRNIRNHITAISLLTIPSSPSSYRVHRVRRVPARQHTHAAHWHLAPLAKQQQWFVRVNAALRRFHSRGGRCQFVVAHGNQ